MLSWLVLGVLTGAWLLVAVSTVNYFSSPQKSKFTKGIVIISVTLSMFSLLLVPVDTSVVGTDSDSTALLRVLYTSSLALGAFWILLVAPFAYFFYEEEEEGVHWTQQVKGALFYTTFFALAAIAILAVGLVLAKHKPASSEHPGIDQLIKDLAQVDLMFRFLIGSLATFGIIGWTSYAAYGLAKLPFVLFPAENEFEPILDVEDVERRLLKNDARIEYLESKKYTSDMSKRDIESISRLRKEQRILERRPSQTQMGFAAKTAYPFRILMFIIFLLLSLLIVVSIAIAVVDQAVNSCRISCGFFLPVPKYQNPISLLLVLSSQVPTLDYILFSLLMVYIWAAALVGLVYGGVRIFCLSLYTLQKRNSMQNALLMGFWMLQIMVLTATVEMQTLLTRYVLFGDQVYRSDPTAEAVACTIDHVTSDQCNLTIFGSFMVELLNWMPFFGTLFFLGNCLFIVSFIGSLVYLLTHRGTFVRELSPVRHEF